MDREKNYKKKAKNELRNLFKTKKEIALSIIALVSISILLSSIAFSFILPKPQMSPYGAITQDSVTKEPASYIVFQDGSTYYARNGRTGEVKYSGGDIANLTSYVFNELAPRTWLERVNFKGSFTVSNTIQIPSYTFLDLSEAKFTANGLEAPMFYSVGSNIEVYGGLIQGNGPQKGTLLYGFFFNGSSNIKISQTKIVSTTWETIYFLNCRNITLISTCHHDSGREGIAVWNDDEHAYENIDLKVIGSTFTDCTWDGIVIDSNNVRGVKIESCTFSNNGYCGIKLNSARETQIVNCQSVNNTQHGIYVQNPYKVSTFSRYIGVSRNIIISDCITGYNGESNIHIKDTDSAIVEGCTSKYSNMHGIWVENCNFTIVKANVVLNNGQAAPSYWHGIYLTGTENSIFSNNVCTDDQQKKTQGVGIYEEAIACDYNTFDDNYCLGNYFSNGLKINGVHSTVHHNQGFCTQNSGMVTINNGISAAVNHGLAGTPTSVIVTPRSNINGDFWVSYVSSTSFVIVVNNPQTVSFYWYAVYDPA